MVMYRMIYAGEMSDVICLQEMSSSIFFTTIFHQGQA